MILVFFFFTFPKKWVGRAMGNETFYGDGPSGNRQCSFKQANHGAYSNLGTQVGGLVEVFRRCFADVLNQSFIVLSVAQASVLGRVCRQSYSKKTANIALRHQRFPREMTFEERAQKFYTDDIHYPDMGSASAWLKICFRGRA